MGDIISHTSNKTHNKEGGTAMQYKEIVVALCQRYGINAADAREWLAAGEIPKEVRLGGIGELEVWLNELEELGRD